MEQDVQELFSRIDCAAQPLWPLEIRRGHSGAVLRSVATLAIGIAFGLLSAFGLAVSQNSGHLFSCCLAEGFLAAFLLQRPTGRWSALLAVAWLGNLISILLMLRYPWALACAFASCNILQSSLAALLVQRPLRRERDLASPAMMLRFLLFAVLLAPAVSGLLASVCYRLSFNRNIWQVFERYFPPHALGMAVVTPLILALCSPDLGKLFHRQRLMRTALLFLLIAAAGCLIFRQTHYSLNFLLIPLLMLVVSDVGVLGAVVAIFEILVIGAAYTLHGRGPFWLSPGSNLRSSVLVLQCAMLALVVTMVPFAAMLERQRQLRASLRMGIQRYQLLADNSRDIVVLVNLEGRRLYVSPAVYDVLGWTAEEWTGQSAADFMHNEDLAAFHRLLKEMLRGERRRTFRYRTLHKNGRYVWMEANIRMLPGEPGEGTAAFVANIRDITERVEAEKRLAEAHLEIQHQAERDSLTQLANRRCFDAALEKEWRRGRRTGNPVALLMVDIDHFKSVNDTYGHRTGDQCLRILADILRKTARRPSDLAARYGGEEFVILLPDVNLSDAKVLAEMLRMCVRQHLFEVGVGRALELTVSMGVAAQIPSRGSHADMLVESADRALYAAKAQGRDRVMEDYGRPDPKAMMTSGRVDACPV